MSTKLKIGVYQMQVHPQEVKLNATQIITCIQKHHQLVDLFIFPELCLTGYFLGDLWEFDDFLKETEYWEKQIVKATTKIQSAVILGNVQVDWTKKGEDCRTRKYNGSVVIQNGKKITHPLTKLPYSIKTLHPQYHQFDDERHFCSLQQWIEEQPNNISLDQVLTPFSISVGSQKVSIGVSLCEDGWDQSYQTSPLNFLSKDSDLIVNLSSSPYATQKEQKRNFIFQQHANQLNIPILYNNCIGIQNNGKNIYTFDGNSALYTPQKPVQKELKNFETGLWVFIYHTKTLKIENSKIFVNTECSTLKTPSKNTQTHNTYQALCFGAREFLKHSNLNKVVIGISGGIDSALAAALYAQILPKENILLVSMPGPFTSKLTQSLAAKLAKNLGCYFISIPINQSIDLTKKQIQNKKITSIDGSLSKQLHLSSFHLENVQARDRSSRILSAISSAFGGVLTCNANKAELTIGYSTLYGDLSGFLALLGDLWKEQVYDLAHHLNTNIYQQEIIPQGIIDIVPSAELNAKQDVEQGMGDPLNYPYHDCLFRSWIEGRNRVTPYNLLLWYQDQSLQEKLKCSISPYSLFPTIQLFIEDLERWWNLYQGLGLIKRIQSPPILSLSKRSFGNDHRESILKAFYSSAYLKLKENLLQKTI